MQQSEVMGEAMMPDLSQADILIWFGDLNYRIDVSYDEAMDLIRQKRYDLLLLKDQLRNEMKSGRTFQGMREGFIKFAPTYKFDRGSQGSLLTVGLGFLGVKKVALSSDCHAISFHLKKSDVSV